MPLTITLDDELAGRLQSQARARTVSAEQWALMILAQAIEHSDDEPSWKQLNRRRLELIHRKYHGGLDEAQESELTALQAVADKHLESLDRPRLDWLRPYEALADNVARQSHE